MTQKVKGGMWCETCHKPVMAVKNTHRLRNATSLVTLPATAALSVFGLKGERYACPTCGSRARKRRIRDR